MHVAPAATFPKITGDDLRKVCIKARKSAQGLDEWAPADLAALSTKAYEWIANMLNTIEAGAAWPWDMT